MFAIKLTAFGYFPTVCLSIVQVWENFEFWCEGVMFSSLGLFGLVSNLASIVTFLSADMRKQIFNQLLAALAVFDIL